VELTSLLGKGILDLVVTSRVLFLTTIGRSMIPTTPRKGLREKSRSLLPSDFDGGLVWIIEDLDEKLMDCWHSNRSLTSPTTK
jgi:hypothetical protein